MKLLARLFHIRLLHIRVLHVDEAIESRIVDWSRRALVEMYDSICTHISGQKSIRRISPSCMGTSSLDFKSNACRMSKKSEIMLTFYTPEHVGMQMVAQSAPDLHRF